MMRRGSCRRGSSCALKEWFARGRDREKVVLVDLSRMDELARTAFGP